MPILLQCGIYDIAFTACAYPLMLLSPGVLKITRCSAVIASFHHQTVSPIWVEFRVEFKPVLAGILNFLTLNFGSLSITDTICPAACSNIICRKKLQILALPPRKNSKSCSSRNFFNFCLEFCNNFESRIFDHKYYFNINIGGLYNSCSAFDFKWYSFLARFLL